MTSEAELPGWAGELVRHHRSATQFYLHGNVRDRFPHGAGYLDLTSYLESILHDLLGYEAVGVYDTLDGLTFRTREAAEKVRDLGSRGRDGATEAGGARRSGGAPRAVGERWGYAPGEDALELLRRAVRSELGCAFVVDFAQVLAVRPEALSDPEARRFLMLAKASREAARTATGRNNLTLFITSRLTDLPSWLYVQNPTGRSIHVPLPEEEDRRRYLEQYGGGLPVRHEPNRVESLSRLPEAHRRDIVTDLTDLTHGLMVRELAAVCELAQSEGLAVDSGEGRRGLLDLFRFGVQRNPWQELLEDPDRRQRLVQAEEQLSKRVQGQDAAIRRTSDIVRRAALGLSGVQFQSKQRRPKGILFFAGPTGVGKTELAKGLAELLFGSDERCLRFDMSEYGQEHSETRLFGAPPSYVGFEAGGQLTNAVKAHPFSVLLFDEIEKAHPKILDKFLQVLDDGRLTSGQGETVYFSECLLIFTSNAGIFEKEFGALGQVLRQRQRVFPWVWKCQQCSRREFSNDEPEACHGREAWVRVEASYEEISREVVSALGDFFKSDLGRPEILNRIGQNLVVFDFIRPPVMGRIVHDMLDRIAAEVRRRQRVEVDFSGVAGKLVAAAVEDVELGARGVGNLLESRVINPLARKLFEEPLREASRVAVTGIRQSAAGVFELEWQPR